MSAIPDCNDTCPQNIETHPSSLRDLVDAIDRARLAIEGVRDAILGLAAPRPEVEADPLLDLDALAAHLGVSTRWVQRNLRPSLRASARGKGWYRMSDVEAQLGVIGSAPMTRTRSRARAAKTPSANTTSTVSRVESPNEIAELEAKLRASLAKPTRRSR